MFSINFAMHLAAQFKYQKFPCENIGDGIISFEVETKKYF